MDAWFGGSWGDVARVATSTLAMYASVLIGLRIAGRRTVSQMSAFDYVVTIAIGSIVGATALSANPSYGRGLTALVTLLAAQQLVAVVRQRVPATRRLLDFSPEPLYADGRAQLRFSPLTAQVTEAELHSKLRHAGVASVGEVEIAVLEPDGRVSVLRRVDGSAGSPLWQSTRT